MAARGPQSLLDRRESNREVHVVRDRLTRQRSPARSPHGRRNSNGSESEEEISVRISQPYRTSFSAVLPPSKGKKDRSRSVSPGCSSLKGSDRSRSKSPGGRRSQPKHVRYSDQVVICESGTSDSVTNLSDRDMNDSSQHFSADGSVLSENKPKVSVLSEDKSKLSRLSADNSKMDTSQDRDYSSELRELSQQIVREYSYPKDKETIVENSSHNHNAQTPNGDLSSKEHPACQVVKPKVKSQMVVTDSYDHDRSISYRAAIKDHYSKEIRQKADALIQEEPPVVQQKVAPVHNKPLANTEVTKSDSFERRNSLPLEKDDTSNKLTPAKRSISSSIGNFFRRLSPHLPRRSKKGNLSTASSVTLSPDDLDRPFNKHASTGNLSRGKLRRSFQKLFGKSKRGSKSSKEDRSVEDLSQDVSDTHNKSLPTSVYLKSIEQGSKSEDMYHKFKNRNTNRTGEVITPVRSQAMKASPRVTSPGSDSGLDRSGLDRSYEKIPGRRAQGANALDVKWQPKSVRSFQGSQLSGLSADGDSIGECSINPNISGSEPSLASQTSASKQVVVSQKDEVIPSIHSPVHAATPSSQIHVQNDVTDSSNKVNGVNSQMPKFSDAELYPDVHESPRTPSYLKISSAVSGYGHYSKYSAYTGIEKRSPYSSTLSLRSSRSDLATPVTPDMPIGKIPNLQPPTNYPPLQTSYNSKKQEDHYVNGHTNGAIEPQLNGENGHTPFVGNFSTTGDTVKDADYFLHITQTEENRLQALCSICEIELLNESLPEEASGKLRAAVGKANLLINQKFRQFQDLCHQHKHPEEGVKRTKWEDLQGFWEMVKIQVDDVDEMFTEIELVRQNGWREIKIPSRRSSSSSSPKSQTGSLSVSNTSTPSHTPGSKRKGIKVKDTPESSPERTQKAKMAARAREEARKKMLAEKRAAMKQQKLQNNDNVEIYVADSSKSNTPEGTPERTQSREGSHERERSEEKERTPDIVMESSVDPGTGSSVDPGTSV